MVCEATPGNEYAVPASSTSAERHPMIPALLLVLLH